MGDKYDVKPDGRGPSSSDTDEAPHTRQARLALYPTSAPGSVPYSSLNDAQIEVVQIAYDLATMQERLGWPRLPDPSNSDDVRNYRTVDEHVACTAIYDVTGKHWKNYPEIPPVEFFAQPKLDHVKQMEPEEALAIFTASVKREFDIKREIVKGSVIKWCPMCLTAVEPQKPTCLHCTTNLEPVLRPKRLLINPKMKRECASFITELHHKFKK